MKKQNNKQKPPSDFFLLVRWRFFIISYVILRFRILSHAYTSLPLPHECRPKHLRQLEYNRGFKNPRACRNEVALINISKTALYFLIGIGIHLYFCLHYLRPAGPYFSKSSASASSLLISPLLYKDITCTSFVRSL